MKVQQITQHKKVEKIMKNKRKIEMLLYYFKI